jgi:hypothetical protein
MRVSDGFRALGMFLSLGFFLVLSSVPGLVIPYALRDGYTRTEAEVLSPDGGRLRNIQVRIASTHDEVGVLRSNFDGVAQGVKLPVWYNPNARLKAGITWYDYRLISAARYPDHVEGIAVAFWLAALIALGGLSGYLIFGGREPVASIRKGAP